MTNEDLKEKYPYIKDIDLDQVHAMTEQAKGVYEMLEGMLNKSNGLLSMLRSKQGGKK